MLECGSCVVQLSMCGPSLLLISTLARSLLLDVDSGKLTQVSYIIDIQYDGYVVLYMYVCNSAL